MFGNRIDDEIVCLREIAAQKHLIRVAEKYKMPLEEQEATKRLLEFYEKRLAKIRERS